MRLLEWIFEDFAMWLTPYVGEAGALVGELVADGHGRAGGAGLLLAQRGDQHPLLGRQRAEAVGVGGA